MTFQLLQVSNRDLALHALKLASARLSASCADFNAQWIENDRLVNSLGNMTAQTVADAYDSGVIVRGWWERAWPIIATALIVVELLLFWAFEQCGTAWAEREQAVELVSVGVGSAVVFARHCRIAHGEFLRQCDHVSGVATVFIRWIVR